MPDTVKFVLVLAFLGGAIYGSAWALSHFPPEQTEIVKPLPSEKFIDIPAKKIRKDNVNEFQAELKARLGAAK